MTRVLPDARISRGTVFRLLRAMLVAITVVFALAAARMFILISERQDSLSKISRYEVAWSATQGANEFIRLQQRVTALAGSPEKPSRKEAELRYEILKGRLKLFRTGQLDDFINESAERRQIVDRLEGVVETLGGMTDRIDDPKVATEALSLMAPLEADLVGLASDANHYSGIKVTEFEAELLDLHRIFSFIALGFLFCASAFIALLGWNNNLLARTHARLRMSHAQLQHTSGELAVANAAVQQANRELSTQNERFDTALNNMARGLCMFDAHRRLIVSNARFCEVYGLSADGLHPGLTLDELMEKLVQENICSAPVAATTLMQHQDLIERSQPGTLLQKLEGGRIISISHQPMENGGWVATYEDVTERHHAEARIAHLARHDALTGLPNRLRLNEHVQGIVEHEASPARPIALMCLDLDNFKNVNDTLGHPIGDALLREVAARITGVVGQGGLVARIGGDEFVIVLQNVGLGEATALASSLLEAVERPYELEGHQVIVGTSIGVALATSAGCDPDELLKNADLALYRAKAGGRGTFRMFEPEMDEQVQRRRLVEMKLRTADFDRDFQLLFQPLVDLNTKRVTTVEALLRWPGGLRTPVSPQEFIPIAEDSGTILPLGRWVLEKACRLAAQLPSDIRIAVNLSPTQFHRGDMVETVSRALAESGLSAERLELEITETLLLNDSSEVLSALERLRSMGARVSLDDFGTGYSSLAYLRKFTFDKVKIDRSFVGGIEGNRDHLAIVQAIVGLTKALGITSVAEGVESRGQLLLIRASGCDEAQGHLFSLPVPEERIREDLDRIGWKLEVA